MNSAIASALAHTLFHFLWEGAVVAIALAFALYVCRPSSARVRYALACMAMLAMLASFCGTLARFWPRPQPAAIHSLTTPRAFPAALALRYDLPAATRVTSRPVNWVAPLWMLGVVLFSLRSLAAWLAALRLRRTSVAAPSAVWQASLARLAAKARVCRPVTLLESYLTDVPVVIGFLKPVILVPASLFTGFPPEHLECILLHELAHIRRHDYLVNLLQSLAEDLLFYHPAVWWVSTVIRTERENCCDDVVVAAQGDALGFAEALAALEQQRWSAYDAALGANARLAANGGHLMNRIRRLLNLGPDRPRFAAPSAFSASLLVAAALLFWNGLVSVTHAQPSPAPQTPVPAPAPQATPRPRVPALPPVPPLPQPLPQLPPQLPPAPAASAAVDTPYKKWLNEEVFWIITPEEREAFKKLATDDEREQFIEQFWFRRDPTPNTVENEYREEYYRRIAYADETFATSMVPGWKTDRGMIYIKYGPPNEREQHPSGGAYQRPVEEGGGTTETFPFEKWRYRYLAAMGNDVVIEFVDPTGQGEYHMTPDPAEKDKLLYVPGAGLTMYEQMGLADKSDRFSRVDGTRLGTGTMPLPASMDQFRRLEQFANLQKPPRPFVLPQDAVEAMVFKGAQRVSQDLLLNLIPTRNGDKLDQDLLDKDVKLLQNTQRFNDVQVRYERGQVGWIVTFTLVERPAPAR